MFVAKVVRKHIVKICIVFTFGTIHVIYLLLNDFNFMRQKSRKRQKPIGESGAMPNYGESRNSRLWPNAWEVQLSGSIFVKLQFK